MKNMEFTSSLSVSQPLAKRGCDAKRECVFFVSHRIASHIHEISDLNNLVANLRAEYTTFKDPKNTLNTRGMLKW